MSSAASSPSPPRWHAHVRFTGEAEGVFEAECVVAAADWTVVPRVIEDGFAASGYTLDRVSDPFPVGVLPEPGGTFQMSPGLTLGPIAGIRKDASWGVPLTIRDEGPVTPLTRTESREGGPLPAPFDDLLFGDPERRAFALMDASKVPAAREVLAETGLPAASLFQGEAEAVLGDAAPVLIELDKGAEFTRRLFTHDPKLPDEMSTLHLWHRRAALFLVADLSLDALRAHLRRFTRVADGDGRWSYWRFWEAEGLMDYLTAAQLRDPAAAPTLFATSAGVPVTAVLTDRSGGAISVASAGPAVPSVKVSAEALRWSALAAHARRFARIYAEQTGVDPTDPGFVADTWRAAVAIQQHRALGFRSRYHLGSLLFWRLALGHPVWTHSTSICHALLDVGCDPEKRFIAISNEMKQRFGNRVWNYHGRRGRALPAGG
ncbi:MAG: DUF4123 domain-containing protein [Pseudomonadota bacterium]